MSLAFTLSPAAPRAAFLGVAAGLLLAGAPSFGLAGEVVVAAANLPPGLVLEPDHIAVIDGEAGPGVLTERAAALGLETKAALYKGRPIRAADLGPRTLIERNALISLVFRRGALAIRTDARALQPGAKGDRIQVMNLDSRRTVIATVIGPDLAEAK